MTSQPYLPLKALPCVMIGGGVAVAVVLLNKNTRGQETCCSNTFDPFFFKLKVIRSQNEVSFNSRTTEGFHWTLLLFFYLIISILDKVKRTQEPFDNLLIGFTTKFPRNLLYYSTSDSSSLSYYLYTSAIFASSRRMTTLNLFGFIYSN